MSKFILNDKILPKQDTPKSKYRRDKKNKFTESININPRVYDLTIKEHKLPPKECFKSSMSILMTADLESIYVKMLRDLERTYMVRVRLDSIDVYKTAWQNELMTKIREYVYPLRKLNEENKDFLGRWEVLGLVYYPYINKKIKDIQSINSFHIFDFGANSRRAMEKFVNMLDSKIKWNHLTGLFGEDQIKQSINKNKLKGSNSTKMQHYDELKNIINMYGIDITLTEYNKSLKFNQKYSQNIIYGSESVCDKNIREWHSQVVNKLKRKLDVVFGDSKDENDNVGEMLFALMNLNIGGCAFIRISRIKSTSLITTMHLFMQCFKTTKLVHSIADDHTYLCGIDFIYKIDNQIYGYFYNFCTLSYESSSLSIFDSKYLKSDEFALSLDKIKNITEKVQTNRYKFYENVLRTYNRLYKSRASKTFQSYINTCLEKKYPDYSSSWAVETRYDKD